MSKNYESFSPSTTKYEAANFAAFELFKSDFQAKSETPPQNADIKPADEKKIVELITAGMKNDKPEESERILNQALLLARKTYGADFSQREECADIVMIYGSAALKMGWQTSSKEYFREARQIYLTAGNTEKYNETTMILAQFSDGSNAYHLAQEAIPYFEKKFADSPEGPEKTQSKDALAGLYSKQLGHLTHVGKIDSPEYAQLTEKLAKLGEKNPISSCEIADARANPASKPLLDVVGEFKDRFGKLKTVLDTTPDGVITDNEIDRAMRNPQIKGRDAVLLNVLKAGYVGISALDGKQGISDSDLIQFNDIYAKSKGTPNKEWNLLLTQVNRAAGFSLSEIEKTNRALAPTDADWSKQAIRQGGVGDCVFLATLAGLVDKNPDLVKKMIEQKSDGSYVVTFPGMPKMPIKVAPITDAEIGYYTSGGNHGVWPIVLEKAWGTYNATKGGHKANDVSPADFAGSNHSEIFKALTGRPAAEIAIEPFRADPKFKESLAANLKRGLQLGPVTAAINYNADTCKTDLPVQHEYTVLAFDEKTMTVTVRNPWGSTEPGTRGGKAKDNDDDGVFTMPFDEFRKNFDSVTLLT